MTTTTKKKNTTEDTSTADELKALVRDAEKLLADSGDEANDQIAELRDRMRKALDEGRVTLDHVKHVAKERLGECDGYVREHPYHAVGVAAGIGALVALLVSRRHTA